MLIDGFLPQYSFAEHHAIQTRASIPALHAAVWETDLGSSPIVKLLMTLRGLGFLSKRKASGMNLQGMLDSGFLLLADEPNEIVIGLVGRFWRPTGGLERIPPNDFTRYDRAGVAKAVTNFSMIPQEHGAILETETRIEPIGEDARRSFARYWKVVGPFSGLIRQRWLVAIRATAERSMHEEV